MVLKGQSKEKIVEEEAKLKSDLQLERVKCSLRESKR